MKATAEKSTTTTSATLVQAKPFFAKAGGGDFFAPAKRGAPLSVQTKLTVNKPGDKFEQEADQMAARVLRTSVSSTGKEKGRFQTTDRIQQATFPEEKIQKATLPEEKIQKETLPEEKVQKAGLPEEKIQKAALPEEKVQKAALPEEKIQKETLSEEKVQKANLPEEKIQKETLPEEKVQKAGLPEEKVQQKEGGANHRQGRGNHGAAGSLQSSIHEKTNGGHPLSSEVLNYMEPRFNAGFGNVRIHTDPASADLSEQLGARAFTYKNHIFFSRDQYQPGSSSGRLLLAHELTHTIQQGATHQQHNDSPVPQRDELLMRKTNGDEKRMFLTRDGKLVELPPDITLEEATLIESEAIAAEKKLGKGPEPKPVPDVKNLPGIKQKPLKPASKKRAKKALSGKNKKAAKAGGKAISLTISGKSAVSQYLIAKGNPVLFKGANKLQQLKLNEQTHDNATEKLEQSEKAVVIPPVEGQSVSNAGQVVEVSGNPIPVADENIATQKLQDSIHNNIPQSIEEVDNFKKNQKARHIGADVMQVVQKDKNAVTATFGAMEQTPPPTPTAHIPESLPTEETAPSTAALNLGQGAIAPLRDEHTDLNNFTKDADNKLKEEGVSQEQLDMVDTGDLAQANKEKKGLEKSAKAEPAALRQYALRQAGEVDQQLKQDEQKERNSLKAKRKSDLGSTSLKQKSAKSSLEKKREEVAGKINGIFNAAQEKVTRKLAGLESESMKRFDNGNTRATRDFEDNVKRGIDAYKRERYSGFFGWARKAKDWLLGMDELPAVKALFEQNRSAFVSEINKLVADITADNKRAIQECRDELARAKNEIKEFVDKLEPGLKDIGQKAAGEMNAKLAELDKFVHQKEQELQQKLKDKQQAAIRAIDEKIAKMKEAMSGALSILGKLLLLAAKKFFTWALEKFGFSLAEIENIINKGVAILKAIFTKPLQFVKNLVNAAKQGFSNFGKRFTTHLKDALFNWLTGSLTGISLPATWDTKGVASVILQLTGISYANIRTHLLKLIPEPVVATLENTFALVKTLVTEGPMAAWEQIREMAGELRDGFVDAVKDWVRNTIVVKAIETIVSMFVPGAGIIRAIIGIYDTIVFFIKKAKDIARMIGNFLGSIGEIAMGNIAAAAEALENGLATALSLVISFLARFLRLDGITGKIKQVIQKIRGKVDAMLDKVALWIVGKAKNLIGSVKSGVRKLLNWWKKKIPVKGGDEAHTLTFDGSGRNATLMLHSAPEKPSVFLGNAARKKGIAAAKSRDHIQTAVKHEARVSKLQTNLIQYEESPKAAAGAKTGEADDLMHKLDNEMGTLGTHIGTTLNKWGVADATIKGVHLPRGSFSPTQKKGIAEQHPDRKDLVKNSKGQLVNLREGLARRHVVSSSDMAKHYENRLNGKKISAGKLLLEQRGSISEARIPVEEVSQNGIQQAAKSRYSKFFGYLRNMFIGDSRENSSIQEHLDKGHPEMAGKKLEEHVHHIKRAWALDDNIEISGVEKES